MTPRATLLLLLLSCRQTPLQQPPEAPQSCLDLQLAAKGLNEFGDPRGTVYPGGTPLFDERTGKRTGREAYVLRKHPDLAQACAKRD